MATIVFFAHDTPENLTQFEYYQQDIDALRTLGHRVVVCTSYFDLPLVFDAMFIWWWTRALLPVLLCRILRRPCIVTGTFNFRFPEELHGRDYFKRPLWQRFLIRSAAKHCSMNLFVSEMEQAQCAGYFGLKRARYFPHCLHPDYLQGPSDSSQNTLLNVTWSGRENLVRKGIPELLSAVRILKDRGVDVRLDLAGLEGDGATDLRQTIRTLALEREVRYLGKVNRTEKISLLRDHAIYVQPSHFEGFGLATLEAMGCGACVLVCDVGAVREVVGECGIYVPPGSPMDLADAIAAVLNERALRSDLRARAAERALRCFSSGTKVERLRKYLGELGIH